ncbi:hypothetical protein, partial [Flavonifractor plautii]|uniref:hypothetical protein n=1 Tax=Flavonifractor plautii TaxID=292800 RepID=UPI001A9A5097
ELLQRHREKDHAKGNQKHANGQHTCHTFTAVSVKSVPILPASTPFCKTAAAFSCLHPFFLLP